nr:ATPase, T2SS/T4P/T4SS family [uncultured Fretibacterium sp.]
MPSFASLHAHQPKLGDILVQAGVIDESQLVRALQIQRGSEKRLGEVLVSENFISETRLAEALSTQLKLPLFTLTRYRPMPEAIRLVPRAVAERLSLIPLSIMEDDLLLVAMSNPLDLLGQDEVRMLTGRNLKVGIATASDINQNLDRLYNLQNNLEEAIEEVDTDLGQNLELDFDASSDEAPVIQLVSNLLQQAVREGASDIHVEVYEKMARVRFRVDGQLYSAFDYPVALHPSVSARLKIMSGMDIAEKRKPQDGRILIRVDGRRIDLRVSVLPTMNGEKVVLRILDQESSSVGLDRLGLEADDMEKIDLFCNMPWGIMLVTGPTGSGKSTTLYSMLQKINQPDVNIITVEDPVEFSVAGINQVHVNEKAGLTFESALRSILRQDPDKVMVGEIRDQKTAQIAIRAALTGHFVLSTLHTNDAPSAATRMIDMGVPPFLVSASLSGVIAQRLVRRLCPICREEYELNENMCETLNVPVGTHAFRPRGCNECRNGYKGRRGIYEIMVVDDDLRRMILEGVSNIQLRAEAIKRGMKTLRQSGINNALAGHTSLEEVFTTTL